MLTLIFISTVHHCITPDLFLLQATHANASKGNALKRYLDSLPAPLPAIAAGDDENDYSMLEQADVRLVVENAQIT